MCVFFFILLSLSFFFSLFLCKGVSILLSDTLIALPCKSAGVCMFELFICFIRLMRLLLHYSYSHVTSNSMALTNLSLFVYKSFQIKWKMHNKIVEKSKQIGKKGGTKE